MRLSCSFCRRCSGGERLPRGWRICGDVVSCGHCRRMRFRQRAITMAVVEPIGDWWQELCAAMAESPTWTLRHDGVWEAQISEGNPVVCLVIGSRWWKLGLKRTRIDRAKGSSRKDRIWRRHRQGTLLPSWACQKRATRRWLCRRFHRALENPVPDADMAAPRTGKRYDETPRRVGRAGEPIRSERSPTGADIYRSSAEGHSCEPRQLSIPSSNVYKI
jgi:hypothetical protein